MEGIVHVLDLRLHHLRLEPGLTGNELGLCSRLLLHGSCGRRAKDVVEQARGRGLRLLGGLGLLRRHLLLLNLWLLLLGGELLLLLLGLSLSRGRIEGVPTTTPIGAASVSLRCLSWLLSHRAAKVKE